MTGRAEDDPRALMFQARAKQRRTGGEDPEGATALYRRVIALVPQSAEAELRLSEALVESGDLDGAVAPATKATELDPRSAEAWVHLGTLQYIRGRSTESVRPECRTALQTANRLVPGDAEILLYLAQVCQDLDDRAGALKAWLKLGRIHPGGTYGEKPLAALAWERAATLATDLNEYEAKREAVMALCRGNHPEARHLRMLEELARDQVEKGYLGHAEDSFLLLAQNVPGEPGIWENIARIQIQTEHFDEALKSLQTAESLKPSPRLTYFKAISYMNLGHLQEAESFWREYFSVPEPTDDKEMQQNASFCFGVCMLLEGRPADLLLLVDSWPDVEAQGDLQALKTQALIQTQDWKAARGCLKNGMERFPKQTPFSHAIRTIPAEKLQESLWSRTEARQVLAQLDLESMAGLWAEFRQWNKCLDLVIKARQASKLRSADLLLLHANALDQLNRFQEATQVYREAQKLKPDDAMVQNNLGYLLLEKGGDIKEAIRLIEASLKQDPKNGSTLDSWGWALFKQGKAKEAEEALRKAVDLRPYNPDIRKHLGEVLLKQGNKEEALAQWERALAYAFPERKELEERTRKLRVELAREQQHTGDENDPSRSDDEGEDEGDD